MLKFLMIAVIGFQGLLTPLTAKESKVDKEEISERLQKFTEAINQGDSDIFSSFWTEDAEFSKPITGVVIEGNEINKFLQANSKEIKDRHLKFTFQQGKIDFPESDFATVEGIVEVTDQGRLLQRTARKVELVKENGEWYIDTVRDIEVAPPPQLYEHLKEIEWLIGTWKDEDENVTITFRNRWDKYKNFINQHFRMKVYGLEVMEGLQIIGWDPIENKIRSWVYDSDGGYGTGLWSKKEDSWTVTINYVLSDGKKASATDIYQKVNDKSYNFSSIDRKVNGVTIANIEPVIVVKEE